MKRFIVGLFFALLSAQCVAEVVKLDIPDTDWSVSFDAPPLLKKQEKRNGSDYVFQANSGLFNLSIFVEEPKTQGATHKDCYEYYWPKASRNRLIAKDSVSVKETDDYVRVQYDIVAQYQGKPLRQRNVNYFIFHGSKWVDVHISIVNPTLADAQIFTAFDQSLRVGN
jgi:hypothetical protein